MKICNRKYLSLFFIIALAVTLAACGKTETAIKLNTDNGGLALRGFDAVAYFAVDNAVRGDAKYEYIWNGAKWLFSSEENMRKFQASPETYAPQFGGYCSFAVSEGYTADADPEAWKVVDGKLYLNYNKQVKQKWEQNEHERIMKGLENWKELGE
jgi:YHS domain-containing protein